MPTVTQIPLEGSNVPQQPQYKDVPITYVLVIVLWKCIERFKQTEEEGTGNIRSWLLEG